MKILAIGDFHGEVPNKLKKKIKKILSNIDIILSPGDYSGDKEYSKIFFKYVYAHRDTTTMEDIVGKKKLLQMNKHLLNSGIKTIKWLNSFKKPVFGVTGNWDFSKYEEIGYRLDKNDKILSKKFYDKIKSIKNFKLIDLSKRKFDKLTIIGYTTSSYPGNYQKINKEKYIKKYGFKKFNIIKNRIEKDYKNRSKKLNKLFKSEKNTIFLSHNSPYGILDIISSKGHKLAKGEHYGSWIVRETILKYKPKLVLCGHMHEYQGIKKLGKSIIINPGAAYKRKAAIINIEKNKIKNIKFIK